MFKKWNHYLYNCIILCFVSKINHHRYTVLSSCIPLVMCILILNLTILCYVQKIYRVLSQPWCHSLILVYHKSTWMRIWIISPILKGMSSMETLPLQAFTKWAAKVHIITKFNSHVYLGPSRRDDILSIIYLLIFLREGSLPWSKYLSNEQKNHSFLTVRKEK